MIKKIIILSISIVVTLLGTFFLGLYCFNVYYSPTGENRTEYTAKYREYLRQNLVDVVNNSDYIKQTKETIQVYRQINGYYYSEKPIYSDKISVNGTDLFCIDIYEDVNLYLPTADTSEERKFLEVYVYSINYTALRNIFMDESVLPNNKAKVAKAEYPEIVLNLYPNVSYKDEESLFYTTDGATISFKLFNDEKIYGSKIDSKLSLALYDFNSNPRLDDNDEPFFVKYLTIRDYQTTVNISDDNDTIDYNNRDRFNNGAFLTLNALLNVDGENYAYELTPADNYIKDLDFKKEHVKLSTEEFLEIQKKITSAF